MGVGEHRWRWVATWAAVMVTVPAAAQEAESGSAAVPAPESVPGSAPASESGTVTVLVAPVQGSEGLRVQQGERVASAVRRALDARGLEAVASKELLGQAVVACQTPECVEQALDAAGATLAIVPAVWARASGGEELTLTLLQRSGRNLNASGMVGEDLAGAVGRLVDELLARRAASEAATAAGTGAASEAAAGTVSVAATEPAHPHAWKAGPIVLIAGGAAAFLGIGIAAGVKSDSQRLNTGAVAAWSVVGAAAMGGGIAWWVVGEKRRRERAKTARALPPLLGLGAAGIDLRLRF